MMDAVLGVADDLLLELEAIDTWQRSYVDDLRREIARCTHNPCHAGCLARRLQAVIFSGLNVSGICRVLEGCLVRALLAIHHMILDVKLEAGV